MSAEAERASAAGDFSVALGAWRRTLELLPSGTRQATAIQARILHLSRQLEQSPPIAPPLPQASSKDGSPRQRSKLGTILAALGTVALLLWKFKFIVVMVLSKAKLLLLGLTKLPTLLSMALSLGVYWSVFGWKLAAGLIASIYIHEMGHVAVLRRYGIKATAPMFVPGLGAFIRMKQYPADDRENARVGLGGPMWGLGAAVVATLVWQLTQASIWAAIAKLGAWINLFNLIPIFGLDGDHAFRALSRGQRWLAAGVIAAALLLVQDGMLILILLLAVIKACAGGAKTADRAALLQYGFLIAALSALLLLEVPGVPTRRAPIFE